MDISQDEADRLFGDDREREFDSVELHHHVSIERRALGVVMHIGDESWQLAQSDVEQMKDECGWDSIWCAISEPAICVDYCQEHVGDRNV